MAKLKGLLCRECAIAMAEHDSKTLVYDFRPKV